MNENTKWARCVVDAMLRRIPKVENATLTVAVDWKELQGRGTFSGSEGFTAPNAGGLESLIVPDQIEKLRVVADGTEAESITEPKLIEWATMLLKEAQLSGHVKASLGAALKSRGTRWYRVTVERAG